MRVSYSLLQKPFSLFLQKPVLQIEDKLFTTRTFRLRFNILIQFLQEPFIILLELWTTRSRVWEAVDGVCIARVLALSKFYSFATVKIFIYTRPYLYKMTCSVVFMTDLADFLLLLSVTNNRR